MDQVVLVDEKDSETGVMEKLLAHQKGLLHRAFSVFIFNRNGDLLLQKRSADKYHSAGLWTNTCCSHPGSGEDVKLSAQKRLFSEMGINCSIEFLFTECYKLPLRDGLTEHEFDHVFYGICNDVPEISPDEVETYRYVSRQDLKEDIFKNPDYYTEWFKLLWERVFESVRDKFTQ